MGISKVIGAVATLLLFISIYLRESGMTFTSRLFLLEAVFIYLIVIASHPVVNAHWLLGKREDGEFQIWSFILFGRFLLLVKIYAWVKRMKRKEAVYNEIYDGLYVGGWPSFEVHVPPGQPAIIDCTCELPRRNFLLQNSYFCIPTWDTRSPGPSEIERAVQWACKKRARKKPIYIHCAFGHGRSVCVMSALLVALGIAQDWKVAERMIKEKRPNIRMNAHHRKNLEEWTKYRTHLCGLTGLDLHHGAQ